MARSARIAATASSVSAASGAISRDTVGSAPARYRPRSPRPARPRSRSATILPGSWIAHHAHRGASIFDNARSSPIIRAVCPINFAPAVEISDSLYETTDNHGPNPLPFTYRVPLLSRRLLPHNQQFPLQHRHFGVSSARVASPSM